MIIEGVSHTVHQGTAFKHLCIVANTSLSACTPDNLMPIIANFCSNYCNAYPIHFGFEPIYWGLGLGVLVEFSKYHTNNKSHTPKSDERTA